MSFKIRPIAIYLPQFHPIPENDEWWGKGFTEWTNVTKAQPKFKGHYQPHLPADLGFYDLRLEESRLAQEKLAKDYGIYGFCYYHYWFNGKRVLEEPIDRKLKNPKEDLPFMMCWANENWSRRWDGSESDILLEQKYSAEDHRNHIEFLIPFFKDRRYIKIDGKSVFAVYRTNLIPDLENAIEIWRNVAKENNIELYILRFEGLHTNGKEFLCDGIDAAVEFQPLTAISHIFSAKPKLKGLKEEFSFSAIANSFKARLNNLKLKLREKNNAIIFQYAEIINADIASQKKLDYKLFPCITPGWDNSARKAKNYMVLTESSPSLFRRWIDHKLKVFSPFSKDENLFFINAWNEWAEGNHLEPDRKWGTSFLEQLKSAITENEKSL
jgi:lipopolysaccharide biosynthesis protein